MLYVSNVDDLKCKQTVENKINQLKKPKKFRQIVIPAKSMNVSSFVAFSQISSAVLHVE